MTALGATAATIFSIGTACIAIGIPILINAKKWNTALWGLSGIATGALFIFITLLMLAAGGTREAFGLISGMS